MKLHKKLNEIHDEGLTEFVQFMVHCGKRDMLIAGVFRQLYHEGESNSLKFLHELITKVDTIASSGKNTNTTMKDKQLLDTDDKLLKMVDLPDSILSNIASYLSMRYLLDWSHVNRKLFETVMTPAAINQWDFTDYSYRNLCKFKPKFRLDPILTKLKDIKYNSRFSSIMDLNKLKSYNTIRIS